MASHSFHFIPVFVLCINLRGGKTLKFLNPPGSGSGGSERVSLRPSGARQGNPAALVVSTPQSVSQLFVGRRCSHFATWKPDELNDQHPSCSWRREISFKEHRAHTAVHGLARKDARRADTYTSSSSAAEKRERERSTDRAHGPQTCNSPMWKAEVWG